MKNDLEPLSSPHVSRRSALKLLSLGAVAASLGTRLSAAPKAAAAPSLSNPAIYRFRIGENDAYAIECGALEFRPDQPSFAVEASPSEFATALRDSTRTNTIRMPFNVLLLDWNGSYVLIDTGAPGWKGEAPLLAQLRHLGVAPESVAHVILTHAHFDHVGGLLDAAGRPVFARAAHHVLKAEVDFWTSAAPDLSQVRVPSGDMISTARRVFDRIEFTYATPGAEIVPGITAFHSPGHTPGHMTLRLTSANSTLNHIADLCHHAPLLMEHTAWTVGSDVDPALAVRTREAVFQTLAASRERVFGFHLPFPGLGSIARSATGGFRWIAEDWTPTQLT
ncbi:MAG TPA: MBL fold metallo-hydrolase [Acidobacteriota bacterium]|nr:MBL fold metallo-hydrolase [Acidobacteriota bacterium]